MTALRSVSLIGAPTDIGAGARGASMGPEALRVARLGETLQSHGVDVVDRGNLSGVELLQFGGKQSLRHGRKLVSSI